MPTQRGKRISGTDGAQVFRNYRKILGGQRRSSAGHIENQPIDINISMKFYRCACFATNNIYLKPFDLHVNFFNDVERFWKDYGQTLLQRGCTTKEQKEEVIHMIEGEIRRRESLPAQRTERTNLIKSSYKPLNPHVYQLQESYLHPAFLELSQVTNKEEALEWITVLSREKKIYAFPVFTQSFCKELIEELDHFNASSLPKERPNTMNHYGLLLGELGFDENFLNPLREKYLRPVASVLFEDWGGDCLDSHKAFTVEYEEGKDKDLGFHFDNAEVTLNVCLGKYFSGGDLYFADMKDKMTEDMTCSSFEQSATIGILHRGQHLHGAHPIKSGKRCNLIFWMRSSKVRNRKCPMCNNLPTLVSDTAFGDGFTDDCIG